MKKVMLSILPALLFNTTVATAEPYWATKPVQCGSTEEIIAMSRAYGQQPSVIFEGVSILPNGHGQKSKFIIATNERKGTWTLFEFPHGSDMGCVLGSGSEHVTLVTNSTKKFAY